jgi:hypothetical protein
MNLMPARPITNPEPDKSRVPRNPARIDLYRRVSCSKLAAEREGIGAVRKQP